MTKPLSRQAAAAKAIRAILKAAYPTVAFRVTSKGYSMGNNVNVHWTDGPTTREVDALVSAFQQGHFDGMTDMYEYSNSRDDIPQTKYLHTTRHMSDDAQRAMVDWLNRTFAGYDLRLIERHYGTHTWLQIDDASDKPRGNGSGWQSYDIHRYFQAVTCLCPGCQAHTLPADAFCPQCGTSQPAVPLNP